MTDKKATKKINWIAIVLVLVVVALAVLYLMKQKENDELTTYFQEEQMELENDFRLLIQEYDSLQVVNNYDSLLMQLDVEQQRVAQLLDELATVKAANAVKLREYRKELSTMRTVMKHYVKQIDSLNTVNEELTKENRYVKAQYQEATQVVMQLEEEKEELNKTIAIASQLEASGIIVSSLNDKGRNARKLSKADKFKVSFTVNKNITTTVGNKTAYLRITNPKLEVLPSPDGGQFQFEDAMLEYSEKRDFEYESEVVVIDIFYSINQFLFGGDYQFDLFVDGVHIGSEKIFFKE